MNPKPKDQLMGHRYFAELWSGKTMKQVAIDNGVVHSTVINCLARAGCPPSTQIPKLRNKAVGELVSAATACEESLRHLGASLHAQRLRDALQPFISIKGNS